MLEYEEFGNTAIDYPSIDFGQDYDYEYEREYTSYRPEEQKIVTRRRSRKKAAAQKGIPLSYKVKVVSRILLVTVLALTMIARFAAVSIVNMELNNSKQMIREQEMKNSNLESILAGSMQLDSIQNRATDLEMSFPSSDQIVYISRTSYDDLVKMNSTNDNQQNTVSLNIE